MHYSRVVIRLHRKSLISEDDNAQVPLTWSDELAQARLRTTHRCGGILQPQPDVQETYPMSAC